jgi:hypothetical protein
VTSWLDNSATNRGNIDPNNWVGDGQRTIDEMAFAWIGFYDLEDEEYETLVAERHEAREKANNDN